MHVNIKHNEKKKTKMAQKTFQILFESNNNFKYYKTTIKKKTQNHKH